MNGSISIVRSDIFLQKLVSFCFVAAMLYMHNDYYLFEAAIYLGIGHIAIAYLYKYHAGKINTQFIVISVVLALLLFGLYEILSFERLLYLVTAIFFIFF